MQERRIHRSWSSQDPDNHNKGDLPPIVADMPMTCTLAASGEKRSFARASSRGRPLCPSRIMCNSSTTTQHNSPARTITSEPSNQAATTFAKRGSASRFSGFEPPLWVGVPSRFSLARRLMLTFAFSMEQMATASPLQRLWHAFKALESLWFLKLQTFQKQLASNHDVSVCCRIERGRGLH
jgi:hypothetical protein